MKQTRVRSSRPAPGLILSLLSALLGLTCADRAPEGLNGPPNVLVILIDDLRPDLGAYGHPMVQTPAIDRLAERGALFSHAYAQAPVCNPSRASLLSGLRPSSTGVLSNRDSLVRRRPDVVTLPGLFHQAGYFTASIGKIFHGAGRRGAWTDSPAWDLERVPKPARRTKRPAKEETERGAAGRYRWRAATGSEKQFVDVRTVDAAVELLTDLPAKPFFMMVGLVGTHPHFEAPKRFFNLYSLDSIRVPSESMVATEPASYAVQGWSDQAEERFSERQQRELIRAYWACVSFVDEQVGRILDTLERFDLARSTVVVLTSDHGYHLGEHDWWSKHTLFEESTRVPLIFANGPGREGTVISPVVELVDLYPTLAELAGLERPETLEGKSLVPLLEDPERGWRRPAFSFMTVGGTPGMSVRTNRWRYTEWRKGRLGVELYDHASDPQELHNLAGDRSYRRVQKRLRRLLRRDSPDVAGR